MRYSKFTDIEAQPGDRFTVQITGAFERISGNRVMLKVGPGSNDFVSIPADGGVSVEAVAPFKWAPVVGSVWRSRWLQQETDKPILVHVVSPGQAIVLGWTAGYRTHDLETAWSMVGPLTCVFDPSGPTPEAQSEPEALPRRVFPPNSPEPDESVKAVKAADHDNGVIFVRALTTPQWWQALGPAGNGREYAWQRLNSSSGDGATLMECDPPQ